MTVSLTQKSFKDIQSEYDQLFRDDRVRDEDRAYAWFAQNVFKYQPDAENILDIACGGGYFLRELKKLAPDQSKIVGTDLSNEALRLSRVSCGDAKLLLSCAENLPFADDSFDAITCLGSLEHFLDIEGAVAEMRRIGTSDARFYILVPNMFWYKDIFSVCLNGGRVVRNQTNERFAALEEWKETLEKAGLSVLKTLKYNGIAKSPLKQSIKELVIPLRFSYHFLYICC